MVLNKKERGKPERKRTWEYKRTPGPRTGSLRLDRAIDDIFKQVDIVVDLEGHDGYEFTGKERKDVSALRVNEQSDKGRR